MPQLAPTFGTPLIVVNSMVESLIPTVLRSGHEGANSHPERIEQSIYRSQDTDAGARDSFIEREHLGTKSLLADSIRPHEQI